MASSHSYTNRSCDPVCATSHARAAADKKPIHRRLDPRTRLVLALEAGLLVAVSNSVPLLLFELLLLTGLILLLRIGRAWVKTLRLLLGMAAIVFVVSIISLGGAVALISSLRLVALVTTFFIFFQVTAPEDLGNGLVKMGVPYPFAFVLTGSMQFVPVLSRKLSNIVDAQRSRGIPLGWHIGGWRYLPALLLPLLIQSLKLSDELAEAMEARGFSREGRTTMVQYEVQRWEYALMAVAMAGMAALWYVAGLL